MVSDALGKRNGPIRPDKLTTSFHPLTTISLLPFHSTAAAKATKHASKNDWWRRWPTPFNVTYRVSTGLSLALHLNAPNFQRPSFVLTPREIGGYRRRLWLSRPWRATSESFSQQLHAGTTAYNRFGYRQKSGAFGGGTRFLGTSVHKVMVSCSVST